MMKAVQAKQRVTFRNILVAMDFSPSADAAVPFAAGLARSFAANLFILHVNEPVNYALPPALYDDVLHAGERGLEEVRDRVQRDYPELTTKLLEGEGRVGSALRDAVKQHRIDVVVAGTQGRTGIAKVFLGSQAEELLRDSPCPVLTVGPNVRSELRKRGKFASILYATDFGPASAEAAPIAVSLAEEYQARLTLLHVVTGEERNPRSRTPEFMESTEEALRKLVPRGAATWCAPHFVVEHGLAAEKILELARRTNADLIVLGVHATEGVPGVAAHLPMGTVHHIVSHAECPVLTVRG